MRMKPIQGNQWKKAKVLKEISPRSFIVRTADGKEYRRNRIDLRKTTEVIVDGPTIPIQSTTMETKKSSSSNASDSTPLSASRNIQDQNYYEENDPCHGRSKQQPKFPSFLRDNYVCS